MHAVIVRELDDGNVPRPIVGMRGTIDPKIRFDLLISPFGLSVCLRVIRRRHARFDSCNRTELLECSRRELRSSIRDDAAGKSKSSVDVVEIQLRSRESVNRLVARNENDCLRQVMIDDY